ncbi:hypothetical protein DL768_006334 [Monosporascus sp. mg162]|nr:hypothetical protein DL768_006334 [Monosporascus sp. mg162]
MLFLRLTHLTLATPGNTVKGSIETKEKASRRDTTEGSIEAQEKTSPTDTAMDSIETKEKASPKNTIEDSIEAQEKASPTDTTKGSIEAQEKTSPTDTAMDNIETKEKASPRNTTEDSIEVREKASPTDAIEGLAKSHMATSVHSAQSPRPMHHQYGSPPTCAGAPLPNQQRPNYKPSALRWPFLSLLFIALVAFIGLLTYAMYALPQRDILPKLINSTSKPDTVRRQVGDAIEIVDGTANSSSPGAPEEPDYSEVTGIMVAHSVTMMQANRFSHDGPVGKRTNSVSVSTQTTPEIVPTTPTDDSGDISATGFSIIPTTVPSESYGDISGTVTEPPPVLTTTTAPENYGDISGIMTEPTAEVTMTTAPENYGDISGTVTESTLWSRPMDSFGDVIVTVTVPPKESNSAPVPTQMIPDAVPTKSTDDSGNISNAGPPVTKTGILPSETPTSVTGAIDNFGDISGTVTETTFSTRPMDSFGDISVTVTFPPKESNSVPVSTQTTPGVVSTESTDDSPTVTEPTPQPTTARENYGDISGTVTESGFWSLPPDSFGDLSVTVTFPPQEPNSAPVSTQTIPDTAPTKSTDDSGNISNASPPETTVIALPPGNHGDISGTVTESTTYASLPPSSFFGDVTVTVTFPHEKSNSVSVSAETIPETIPTRPTEDSGDMSSRDPPVMPTSVPPVDDFGDVSVTVTFPHGRSNSVSVPTETIPEIIPTRSTDNSGDISTTGPPVIITTVPPSSFGRLSGSVTESAPPSTVPSESHGDISGTVTVPPLLPTTASENFGHVSGTVTEPAPPSTRPSSSFGDVIVTVTLPHGKSNSDSVSTETTPEIVPTRPTDDYGDISSTDLPGTRLPDDFGGISVTETFPPVETRLPDDSGLVDPAITTATENSTDNGDEVVLTLVLTPTLAVETDANGIPTATLTKYPSITSVIPTSHTTVLTNSLGQPTGTVVTDALLTPSITVETDLNGIPTTTRTSYGIIPTATRTSDDIIPTKEPESTAVRVWRMTYGEYFIGMFLPTILAMAISIPIRILDVNVKLLQPWHELAKPGGASGRRSLCLETGGWWGLINAVRWVFGGQVLIVLTTSLVLASALLVPLSAEAIAFDLQGTCVKGSGNAKGCVYVVSVFREAAAGTLALLALMAMMVFTILFYLVKWQSGVGANPWSICGIASLSLNEDVRKLFPSHADGGAAAKAPDELMTSILKDRFFTLGYFKNSEGGLEYGIMLQENDVVEPYLERVRDENTPPLDETHWYNGQTHTGKKHHQPFFMLKYSGRVLLLMLLCGILALILYYNNTGGDTGFEHFMMSESFGVRFLFSGVGFIIILCWSAFFNSVAVLSPYHLLARAPQSAGRSILLAPPTNAFSGLWSAIRRRDGFLAVVALTSVLSELLPVLLAEIPFRVSQTYLVHLITTWSAVGILCIMLLVLISSFFVKWPHMPLDPTTVAGAMYYVADSWMLSQFDGLGTLGRKDRDRRVVALDLKYRFGPMTGVGWETRVGVDVAGDLSSIAGW